MKLKRLLSVLLCIALFACCAPIALAAQDAVTVTFWFANGKDVTTAFDLTVTDGTAERYGYTPVAADHNSAAVETVTVLDVLVAAHKAVYGDAFTKETAGDYLTLSYGYSTFATKAFGVETSNMGFTVNDATPHDDTYMESSYGGYYTGYALDTARVQDGDRVCLYVYKDAYWADMQALFNPVTIEAQTNKAFTVSAAGYSIMFYGSDKQEVIDRNTKPLAGMTVECTQDFETFTPAGTLDADGKLSLKLSEAGTYYYVVRGMFDDSDLGDVPVIANYCTAVVTESEPMEPTLTLQSAPEKTAYYAGESVDTSGLSLLYTDKYGDALVVTEGFTCTPETLETAGNQTVTVTYEGLSVTFEVSVEAVVPVSLKVVSAPTNSTFTYKHNPDFSGLVVSVVYNDGHERITDDLSEMEIQPASDARVRRGTQSFCVRVEGVSETFDMQVRLTFWQWLILIFLFGWIWY